MAGRRRGASAGSGGVRRSVVRLAAWGDRCLRNLTSGPGDRPPTPSVATLVIALSLIALRYCGLAVDGPCRPSRGDDWTRTICPRRSHTLSSPRSPRDPQEKHTEPTHRIAKDRIRSAVRLAQVARLNTRETFARSGRRSLFVMSLRRGTSPTPVLIWLAGRR